MARTITAKHAATLQGYGFNTAKVSRAKRLQDRQTRDHRQTVSGAKGKAYR